MSEEKTPKPITLNELAERNAGRILPDGSVHDCKVSIAGEIVLFSFKPLSKKIVIKAQSGTKDELGLMDYILTHSLWNRDKGKNGDFWSTEEIEQGIPDAWQILLFAKIMDESGFNITKEELGF